MRSVLRYVFTGCYAYKTNNYLLNKNKTCPTQASRTRLTHKTHVIRNVLFSICDTHICAGGRATY